MSPLRNGNFTSGEIVALLSMGSREMTESELEQYKKEFPKGRKKNIESWPGKAAVTYIEECNMERRLGRSLTDESNARPLSWGKLLERRVFDLLGIEYRLCSDQTLSHPEIGCWFGTPDIDKKETTGDIKCPMTLKSFCLLVDPLYNGLSGLKAMNLVRDNHPDGEKFYWQIVSNSILSGSKYGELISYMPYKSELEIIRELALNIDDPRQYVYKWIGFATDDEIPWLPDGGYYKNINVIRFEVPEEDKQLLTERVVAASKELKEFKTVSK